MYRSFTVVCLCLSGLFVRWTWRPSSSLCRTATPNWWQLCMRLMLMWSSGRNSWQPTRRRQTDSETRWAPAVWLSGTEGTLGDAYCLSALTVTHSELASTASPNYFISSLRSTIHCMTWLYLPTSQIAGCTTAVWRWRGVLLPSHPPHTHLLLN